MDALEMTLLFDNAIYSDYDGSTILYYIYDTTHKTPSINLDSMDDITGVFYTYNVVTNNLRISHFILKKSGE